MPDWPDPVRFIHEQLPTELQRDDVLRSFRGDTDLVVLAGDWADGGAIVASEPQYRAPVKDDPFLVMSTIPKVIGQEPGAIGGGWFGYLGYQLGGGVEQLPDPPPRPTALPAFSLAYYDHVLRYDGANDQWWFEALWSSERAPVLEQRLATIRTRLLGDPAPPRRYTCTQFQPCPDAARHRGAVERCIEYIRAGDIYQANICMRLEAEFTGDPFELYLSGLLALDPARSAYISGPWGAIASFSPELFLHRIGREVRTVPIKGTARRGSHRDEDEELRAALEVSEKDRAENVMIVDLMRNDLGRVCEAGSVRVPSLAGAQDHPGLWHLASVVTGQLHEGSDDADLLRACFPPGSVTGAPKKRAMEIIHELETTAREVYTGTIGYASPLDQLEFSVAIRTFEIAEGRIWLGVGGGIVADSDPEAEREECYTKAAPLIDAIGATVDDTAAAPLPIGGSSLSRPVRQELGVFETILVKDKVAIELHAHLERMRSSVHTLYGVALDPGATQLATKVAAEAHERTARLRLLAKPGPDGIVSLTAAILPMPEGFTDAQRAGTALTPIVISGGLGPHKWCDRDAITMRNANLAEDEQMLLVDEAGFVLETARANLFAVFDGSVVTPPCDGRILPGITRSRALSLLRLNSIPVREEPFTLERLRTADEVFTTGSLRGVEWVSECAPLTSWAHGPITAMIGAELERFVDGQVTRVKQAHRSRTLPSQAVRHYTPVHHSDDGIATGPRILVIDNYDSFTFNLVQYLLELGAEPLVARNDGVSLEEAASLNIDGIVISPGPCTPREAGISTEMIRTFGERTPILGVCLGHQCIAQAYGAVVARAQQVVHGKRSLIHHDGTHLYRGIPSPIEAARYHSLIVAPQSLPDELVATAWTEDGYLMGIRHRTYPVEGVQFHPESILTQRGHELMTNFLNLCKGG